MFLFFSFRHEAQRSLLFDEPKILTESLAYDQQVVKYGRKTDEPSEVGSEVREPLRGGGSRATLLG